MIIWSSNIKVLKRVRLTLFLFFCFLYSFSQQKITLDTINNTVYIGEFKLKQPSSLISKYKYDPKTNLYIYQSKIGQIDVGLPLKLSPEDYRKIFRKDLIDKYFNEQVSLIDNEDQDERRNLLPDLYINSNFFESIFGGNEIELIPQGSVAIDLGARYNKRDNPTIPVRNRSNLGLDFNQLISLSLSGKIGEKLTINSNYDSQSTFDFQNLLKLDYTPNEDDIIQKIELGNVSMPISGSLISGAQSLFGFKTQLKFGNTTIDAVLSEQRSQSKTLSSSADGSMNEFSFSALDYESNRHFYLAHFFRKNFDKFLETYPYVNSPIRITRLEVWVTNKSNETDDVRNIIALQDLAETDPEFTNTDNLVSNFFVQNDPDLNPDNSVNNFDPNRIGQNLLNENIRDITNVNNGFSTNPNLFNEGSDYSILENARKLDESEYSYDEQLGYISLQQSLNNDEVLGVSFQYTLNGKIFQVGEFSDDGIVSVDDSNNKVVRKGLIVKLLKSSINNVRQPVWKLTMKNIYNLGSFQISETDFRLNIFYNNPSSLNYISPIENNTWPQDLEKIRLLNLFELDKLDSNGNLQKGGDGFFDAIDGITIIKNKGLLVFPKEEPFGKFLFEKLRNNQNEDYNDPTTYNQNQLKYVYNEMYTFGKTSAEKFIEKNKFNIRGKYKSTSSNDGINTGEFNIAQGSIVVSAGGRILREGIDYLVNYQNGNVEILDESLKNSNIPIEISTESNSFYNQQKRRFSGFNVEHKFSDKFKIGATLLNLSERSISRKSNYGVEPVNNTTFGINAAYFSEAPFLTRIVNKLPNVNTDVISNISLKTEFAVLKSSDPRKSGYDESASVYIDDFEASQNKIDLRDPQSWKLSSIPVGFAGYEYGNNDLRAGYNRARLSWYTIDPIFYSSRRPNDISLDEISKNSSRRIFIDEIFPEIDLYQGESRIQSTFDLTYYPDEKGPYNNNQELDFKSDNKKNWSGITRKINSTNFKKTNVEYIQFWLLDDFSNNNSSDLKIGEILFHLGNISEDILPDGKKQFENGLPNNNESNFQLSNWGRTPTSQSLTYSFSSNISERESQDLGYDGLDDIDELEFYNNGNSSDPANDNYKYYLDQSGNILDRYKYYNGVQGNSPVNASSNNRGSSNIPDVEDVNNDNTMNRINSYFEYKIPLFKNMSKDNHPFVADVRENNNVKLPNGNNINSRWILFKVPIFKEYYEGKSINQYFNSINGINDLKSISFIRLALKDFENPTTLRFGTLDLVKTDWKRFTLPLNKNNNIYPETNFEIGTVNIHENENRLPVNYVLPPGIEREEVFSNNSIIRQNEQSLTLKVKDLQPADSRAVYKNIDLDLRQYKRMKMYIHAESLNDRPKLPGDGVEEKFDERLVAFLRLGSDINDNYYQIEVPLKPTSFNSNFDSRLSPEQVWKPESNSIEFDLEKFLKIKLEVISQKIQSNEAIYFDEELNVIDEFTQISQLPGEKKYKFSIRGNPSLGRVKTVLLGLKNPSEKIGNTLSGEVWFNELRISNIKNSGGWSAIANLDANFADFANISLNGRISSIGFGSIDKSPNERSNDSYKQFNFISNINAGQLLPEDWGINIPVSYTYSEEITKPKYDSFYDDIELNKVLDLSNNKDSIVNQSQILSNSKSFSVLGLSKKKNNQERKRFYDIENLNFSYTYSENNYKDYELEYADRKSIRANANYSYNFEDLSIYPFEKLVSKESKYLNWLKEFNFNPLPSNLSFSGNFFRSLYTQKFREINYSGINSNSQIPIPELSQKKFLFDWRLSLSQNLTKSIRVNYNASNSNIVPNINGNQSDLNSSDIGIFDNFFNIGDPDYFNQNFSINYSLPFNLIPFLNFIDGSYNYSGDFNWQRGSDMLNNISSETGEVLGRVNTIQNANTQNFSLSLNFDKIYRTIPWLNKNESIIPDLIKSLKRVRFNYSENSGKVLPGYIPSIGFLGTARPSIGFVFGNQSDIRYEAAKNGWLTDFPNFNQPFQQIFNSDFDFSGELELFNSIRIDLNANRRYSNNFSENFSVINNTYSALNPNYYGNFSISTNMLKTSFSRRDKNFSNSFEKMKNNRLIVAQRLISQKNLNNINLDSEGFPIGFSKNSQEVLINSFLSAYLGKNPNDISLNPISKSPKLNWSLQYDGLSKLFENFISRLSIGHGYRSSFTINNFRSNLNYSPNSFDNSGNYMSEKLYSNINLVEQFNPLIEVDIEFKNSLRLILDVIKDRAVSLSLANNFITESWGNEYVIGLGYRARNVRINSSLAPNSNSFVGDLNTKLDFSVRKNMTVIRNLNIQDNKVSAGQTLISAKLTADYALTRNFSAIFFYDHMFSKYEISSAFPQTNIRSGFTLRYNFGN